MNPVTKTPAPQDPARQDPSPTPSSIIFGVTRLTLDLLKLPPVATSLRAKRRRKRSGVSRVARASRILTGWLKLYRKMMESTVWTLTDSHFKVWITCLLLANIKEASWFNGRTKEIIPRGSFVTSREHLAKDANVSQKKVRQALANLEAIGAIRAQGRAKHSTLITIVNFDVYQPMEHSEGQAMGQGRAKRGPTEGHNERSREVREEEKTTKSSADAATGTDRLYKITEALDAYPGIQDQDPSVVHKALRALPPTVTPADITEGLVWWQEFWNTPDSPKPPKVTSWLKGSYLLDPRTKPVTVIRAPRGNPAVSSYVDAWTAKYGEAPADITDRDAGTLARLYRKLGPERYAEVLRRYFVSTDRLVIEQSHPTNLLVLQVNNLAREDNGKLTLTTTTFRTRGNAKVLENARRMAEMEAQTQQLPQHESE